MLHAVDRADLARIAGVGAGLAIQWAAPHAPLWIGLMVVAVGGYPVLREALSALARRHMTMELSMTIAIAAALAIGEISTALVILLFVLSAEVLEHLTMDRGRRSIRSLLERLPARTLVREAGGLREVAVAALSPGAIVVTRPGEQVPVDGVVRAGRSTIDESTITGESMPAEKVPGARVFAGTLNQDGAIDIAVERIGGDTAFGRIIHLIEDAERSKAPAQKLADRIAGWLVAFTLACAGLTLLVTHDARSTIAVVIVAGACGIAAGTPLAILGAVARAARDGVVVKGGRAMEALSSLDAVVLDKTGTVTLGVPTVTEIRPCARATTHEVLEAAACAERLSEHPVAKAILTRAADAGIEVAGPDGFESIPGQGVVARRAEVTILVGRPAFVCDRLIGQPVATPSTADDATEIFVARADRLLGRIYIRDVVRPESRAAVAKLRERGLEVALLTGDHRAPAEAAAAALGVDTVAAEMLPADKAAWIDRALDGGRRRVAMVGDGVNDAPALRRASVGIAMGSGSDVARESADVLLIGSDLSRLVRAIDLARRCRRIIFANFVGTLAVDAIGMVLAALGMLPPSAAALVHVSSELAFILNAARLLPPLRQRAREGVCERTVAEKSLDRAGQVA